jgi:hypothetical protein
MENIWFAKWLDSVVYLLDKAHRFYFFRRIDFLRAVERTNLYSVPKVIPALLSQFAPSQENHLSGFRANQDLIYWYRWLAAQNPWRVSSVNWHL